MSAGKEAEDLSGKPQLWQPPSIGQRQTDPLGPSDPAMEINNHFQHIAQKEIPNMYVENTPTNNPPGTAIQAQLIDLEKQYRMQEEMLSRQYEEQRRMLAHEQQIKMQEYLKMMMVQQQQQEFLEQQKKIEEQRQESERKEKERIEKLELLKNKKKDDESAIASNEVKLKLRECLLNKGHRDPHIKNSPPEFRHWATQHSSLEQHSPPTSGLSPPLQGPHMLGRYEDEYPLRKTVSEPNLKMKSSKISLRQKVMQRNSPLLHRRDLQALKKKAHVSTSEPNLKVRLALKQKMIERRSSPLLRRKDRFGITGKRNPTTPLTNSTLCNSSPDSGPNSPPSSSQGSSAEAVLPKEGETTAFPLQMMSKMVINQSMPNISIGQPRGDKLPKPDPSASLSMSASEAELRARAAAQYGIPIMSGFYHLQGLSESEMSPTDPAIVEAQMKALELARSTGQLPISPLVVGGPFSNMGSLAEFQAAQARLQRTQSAPLPLPGAQLWNHQMLLQKQHEQLLKENQKHYLKQKLQNTLLQRVGSKNHMENVDEAAETRLVQEMREIREKEDNDVMVIHEERSPQDLTTTPSSLRPHSKDREAFILKMRQRTISGGSPPITAGMPRPPALERAQSNPTMNVSQKLTGSPPTETAVSQELFSTGVAYDTLMLKHGCICGDNVGHPEHAGRLQSIWARLQETGLINKCERIKSRKATPEELQTCHSEAYVGMYGSSPSKIDPLVFETFSPRFTKLGCGGIGVDSDTTFHELYTPQAARMAAGCVIELAFKVARGDLKNGFAFVRPPGHHAEDTQAMGFCYFNSIAVATKLLLDRLKMKKILIVDWDVHHGNSTQQLFYTDPRVLYISLHRHDNGNFFPGTGAPEDCGIERGVGFNVNIAWSGSLTPAMSDAEYLAAFRTIVMPIAREFNPEIVLVSAGFDAATGHPAPLGGYDVSPKCFGHMAKQLMTLADGHIALVLEGGYELQPICDSSEMCLRALLGEDIPMLDEGEMRRVPNAAAIETLEMTMKVQAGYWPVITRYSQSLGWSLVEAQKRDNDEADTVSAFASLSMAHAKQSSLTSQDSTSTTGTGEDLEQPMEES